MTIKSTAVAKVTKVTKQGKLLKALQGGQKLTAKQISTKFGIANPRATVSDLRGLGFSVKLDRTPDSRGRVTTKYTLA
jgi:hypothetical protein